MWTDSSFQIWPNIFLNSVSFKVHHDQAREKVLMVEELVAESSWVTCNYHEINEIYTEFQLSA